MVWCISRGVVIMQRRMGCQPEGWSPMRQRERRGIRNNPGQKSRASIMARLSPSRGSRVREAIKLLPCLAIRRLDGPAVAVGPICGNARGLPGKASVAENVLRQSLNGKHFAIWRVGRSPHIPVASVKA